MTFLLTPGVKGIKTIPLNGQTHSNCSSAFGDELSVFDHFVVLALMGLTNYSYPFFYGKLHWKICKNIGKMVKVLTRSRPVMSLTRNPT